MYSIGYLLSSLCVGRLTVITLARGVSAVYYVHSLYEVTSQMRDSGRLLLRYKYISSMFGLFMAVYIAQIFVIPANPVAMRKYNLSELQYHETLLAIALPYIVIWGIALIGYLRLKSYTAALGESKDGKAFQLIAKGMFWFTLWLPLSALIGVYGEYAYREHVDFMPNIVRMMVYANTILLIPAFVYAYQGSTKLLNVTKTRLSNPTFKSTVGFIIAAAVYTFIVMHDTARQVAVDANTPATYYMSDWIILLTVVIPRLILWYLGILAAQNIFLYSQKVHGVIYRQGLRQLAIGIGGVTTLIVVLRIVQSLSNPLSKLSLTAMLLIIFGILILMAVGYIFISKGAQRLLAIEES